MWPFLALICAALMIGCSLPNVNILASEEQTFWTGDCDDNGTVIKDGNYTDKTSPCVKVFCRNGTLQTVECPALAPTYHECNNITRKDEPFPGCCPEYACPFTLTESENVPKRRVRRGN